MKGRGELTSQYLKRLLSTPFSTGVEVAPLVATDDEAIIMFATCIIRLAMRPSSHSALTYGVWPWMLFEDQDIVSGADLF